MEHSSLSSGFFKDHYKSISRCHMSQSGNSFKTHCKAILRVYAFNDFLAGELVEHSSLSGDLFKDHYKSVARCYTCHSGCPFEIDCKTILQAYTFNYFRAGELMEHILCLATCSKSTTNPDLDVIRLVLATLSNSIAKP